MKNKMDKNSLIVFNFFVHFISFALLLSVEQSTFADTNEKCFACHRTEIPIVNEKEFKQSVHGSETCNSCHVEYFDYPHPKDVKPVFCGTCHEEQGNQLVSSDHGKVFLKELKEPTADICTSCHSKPHSVLPPQDLNSTVNRIKIMDTCNNCHLKKTVEKEHPLKKTAYKTYTKTVHGKAFLEKKILTAAICTECHGVHDINFSINSQSHIYKFNVPNTCGKCHTNIMKVYKESIHGQAVERRIKEAPVCTDCHGEHNIVAHNEPGSTVSTGSIVRTCSHCHASETINIQYKIPVDSVKTYMASYHGIGYQYGSSTVANCATCHHWHDIFPSTDRRSSIYPANLVKLCGKCHPGVTDKVALGSVHITLTPEKNKIIFYVKIFYIALIVLVIGGMITHNLLDFGRKLYIKYHEDKENFVEERFNYIMRLQHLVLLISFIMLAYTGFAHKFPNAWWALPFKYFTWGAEFRKLLHRGFAILFVLLMFFHLPWLLFSNRGKKELVEMLPKLKDIQDLFKLIRYNLGITKQKPLFTRYNYIEKSEYWALVWGAVIMTVTGFSLMFEEITLRYFPKWLIDVFLTIHFYEAILASLAILVWHFYWVIFDPEIYPLNWVAFFGKITKKQKEERIEIK